MTRVLAVTLTAAEKAESATVKKPADKASSAERDEQSRRLIVGVWQDNYQGKRTMTLKDDGTGTMVVELSGLQATLFASRLEFDLAWSVDNGRFKERTTGGKPYLRVQAILKTMGDRVDQPILELTDDRLLLLDKDGKTKYDWRRVRERRSSAT
jgi:hypothetical protein